MGDAYVEIGPADADYERLAAHAITEQQLEERRRQWQEGRRGAATAVRGVPGQPGRGARTGSGRRGRS